jgi:hypothetical protein
MKKLILVMLFFTLSAVCAFTQNTKLIVETSNGESAAFYQITSRLSWDSDVYVSRQVGTVPGVYSLENGYYEFEVGLPFSVQFDVSARGGTQHWTVKPTDWLGVFVGLGLTMGTGVGGAFALDLSEDLGTWFIIFAIGSAIGLPIMITSFGSATRLD